MISIDEEHTDLLAGYIALWDKVSGVTESTFQQISLEVSDYVHHCNYVANLNVLIELQPMIFKGTYNTYKGTWLHHLVLNQEISLVNLVYALAIIINAGGAFEKIKDSNGYTPYALLTTRRYYGYQIFQDIKKAVLFISRCQK